MKLNKKAKSWIEQGRNLALATVIKTWGSSPRPEGSQMLITEEGEIAGSVSGGCVEGAVVEAGFQALEDGTPRRLHFGVKDETAWEVGLACGGELDVFVMPMDADDVEGWIRANEMQGAICSVMVIDGPEALLGRVMHVSAAGEVRGAWGKAVDEEVIERAQQRIKAKESGMDDLPGEGLGTETLLCFFHVDLPQPTLVAVGGVHIAIPLMEMAKAMNYRTVVVDPRKLFATQDRFPEVDLLLPDWPEEAFREFKIDSYTAIAMLTHDPKIDDPALRLALNSRAFYIGALGSQKTQRDRRRRLIESGVREALIDKLHAPIGLDLGGRAPQEIAVAVMAEIVQELNSRL